MGQSEMKERAAADDEITAIAMIARDLTERESRERQKNEEDHVKRHNDLATNVNQQHQATRDLHSAGLETHANNIAKKHATEKEERTRETGELRRNLQAL